MAKRRTHLLNIKQSTIEWITRRLKIPTSAMRMFKAANDISGIDKNILPTELVPLNAIQISRGLLNFTLIQSRLNWILPYWAIQQYDPLNKAFIPRSHLGLSMNVTHRNWTAVGNPDCKTEPVVDPAGMITPFKNGWSIDTWLRCEDKFYFPSKEKTTQNLIDNLPITETSCELNGLHLISTAYTSGTILVVNTRLKNTGSVFQAAEIIFAVRPFNPEGISLVTDIETREEKRKVIINNEQEILFDHSPDHFICSNFENGDCAELLKKINDDIIKISCKVGLANSASVFKCNLNPGEEKGFTLKINLSGEKNIPAKPIQEHIDYWKNILNAGTRITSPDKKLNALFYSSAATLVMLSDKEEIMPGPFTYHQFWFRDAAYMLFALDKIGFQNYSHPVINNFKKQQDKKGYFRSQKGEWDSNGQAIWTIYQHYLLTRDIDFLTGEFESCLKGIKWIEDIRIKKREHIPQNTKGLMPKGLSAEHLGLVDYYYWDNFWSLAGVDSFINICREFGKKDEEKFAQKIYAEYAEIVLSSIKNVQNKYGIDFIPAGPERDADYGMIGSVCMLYPLSLTNDSGLIKRTLDYITSNYFVKGLFFQNFIHSGLNIYLTLQIAHSYLLLNEKMKFLEILTAVVDAASPTMNYPEAIHPATGGGSMGDGHHGWAAAEVALAVRDAFVYENNNAEIPELIFFSGIPDDWFNEGKSFSISQAPTFFGRISAAVSSEQNRIKITILTEAESVANHRWKLFLPAGCSLVRGNIDAAIRQLNRETEVILQPGNIELHFSKENILSEEALYSS